MGREVGPRMICHPPRVDTVTMEEALAFCEGALGSGKGISVLGVNAAVVELASRLPGFAEHFDRASLVLPDGMGVVLGYRFLGQKFHERVATPDFVDALLARNSASSVFLLGGTAAVVDQAAKRLRHRGIEVVGAQHGYFPQSEIPAVARNALDARPAILLVGMPSPMKETFISHLAESSDFRMIAIGVGGYMDILAGSVPRAPRFLGGMGLEWLYRLAREPRRLARRYLIGNFVFARLVWRWRRGGRHVTSVRSR